MRFKSRSKINNIALGKNGTNLYQLLQYSQSAHELYVYTPAEGASVQLPLSVQTGGLRKITMLL